jgi:hypothetical protein
MISTMTVKEFIGEIEGRFIQKDETYTLKQNEMEELLAVLKWTIDARMFLEETEVKFNSDRFDQDNLKDRLWLDLQSI